MAPLNEFLNAKKDAHPGTSRFRYCDSILQPSGFPPEITSWSYAGLLAPISHPSPAFPEHMLQWLQAAWQLRCRQHGHSGESAQVFHLFPTWLPGKSPEVHITS